jgi:DNA-binding transcriptional LysR family regulator
VELHHLRYFVAVVDDKSFTRAAQRLHVVQSAVSAAVRALERELGADLLERSSQGVRLTAAGRTLLPHAVATLDAARDAQDSVLGLRGTVQGTLRLGGVAAAGLLDIPALLGRYHQLHPDVTLQLRIPPDGSAGHARALLAGDLDAAFLSLVGPRPSELITRELASVPMVLLVPAGHRLAGAPTVVLDTLVDESFVDSPVGYGNRDLVDRAFAALSPGRQVTLESTDIATTAAFVQQGLGVALLPSFMADSDAEGLAVVPATEPGLTWPLHLATAARRRMSAPLQALLAFLDAELPDYLAPDRTVP